VGSAEGKENKDTPSDTDRGEKEMKIVIGRSKKELADLKR